MYYQHAISYLSAYIHNGDFKRRQPRGIIITRPAPNGLAFAVGMQLTRHGRCLSPLMRLFAGQCVDAVSLEKSLPVLPVSSSALHGV
jgi:hypothetical protein